jgi:hypothetical protein
MIEFIQKFCLHLVAIFLDLLLALLFLDRLFFFLIRSRSNDLLLLGLNRFFDFFIRLNLLLLLLLNNWLFLRLLNNFLSLLGFSWFSFNFSHLGKGGAVLEVIVLIGNIVLEPALGGLWGGLAVLVELARLELEGIFTVP